MVNGVTLSRQTFLQLNPICSTLLDTRLSNDHKTQQLSLLESLLKSLEPGALLSGWDYILYPLCMLLDIFSHNVQGEPFFLYAEYEDTKISVLSCQSELHRTHPDLASSDSSIILDMLQNLWFRANNRPNLLPSQCLPINAIA